MDTQLSADRDQIARFVEAMFRHADRGTFVSTRGFRHADGRPWPGWRCGTFAVLSPTDWGFDRFVDFFAGEATEMARAGGYVFCPPVATFKNSRGARSDNLACGLALSVELDERPSAGRGKLEALLGPATVVVASGGEWVDPSTGEVEPKLHLHWRLAEPTQSPEEHALLREARRRAAEIAGGDATAVPPVHPLRWPGSWHLKDPSRPRLARIVAEADAEIALDGACAALGAKAPEPRAERAGDGTSKFSDVELWMSMIPNAPDCTWNDWNLVGMALFAATGGSDEGLRLFHDWSRKNAKYDEAETSRRWAHWFRSPPTRLSGGKLAYLAGLFFEQADRAYDGAGDAAWEAAS